MSEGFGLRQESNPPDLGGLEREKRVEAMVSWFLENFEDPAEHTPHDSGEGGYQYIWGGPYDALDQIGTAFPDAAQDEIDEAVDEVQTDGTFDWAPSDGRVQPIDDDIEDGFGLDVPPVPPLSDRLEMLAGQLDRIEGHVTALLKLQESEGGAVGIGHNGPPEEDGETVDLRAVQESIDDVRAELAKPDRENDADAERLVRAETRFRRFMAWIGRQVSEAPSNLAKGAVVAVGGLMVNYVANNADAILADLEPAISTISSWVMAVQSWF